MGSEESNSHDWVMESAESSDEDGQSAPSTNDFVFVGDMAFQRRNFANDIQSNGNLRFSAVKDRNK